MASRTERSGKTSLMDANTSKMGTQKSALMSINTEAISPTTKGGKKFNIKKTRFAMNTRAAPALSTGPKHIFDKN